MNWIGSVGGRGGALASVAVAIVLACLMGGSAMAAELSVGDAAPDFSLMGSDGETYTLSQFKGIQPVVLAFFPKAFTPG